MESNIEKRARLRTELDSLKGRYQETRDDGTLERLNNIKQALTKVEREIVREASEDPNAVEAGHAVTTRTRRDNAPGSEERHRALRTIDGREDISSTAGDRLEDLVRRDRSGSDARYINAVASEDYERAFGKLIANPQQGHLEMTREEQSAVRDVAEARTMQVGTPSLGGFAIPFALDPTIRLESDGAVNPIRQLATVTQITTDEWRGIGSEGITASFAPELTEVGDNSPELRQPTITPEKAQAWVPFSIEAGQDWPALQSEVTSLFLDAKDVLEASKFNSGTGVNEPQGLLVGGTFAVSTAGTATYAVADVYSLQESIPARWAPRASWLGSNPIINRTYRFGGGNATEPPLINEARTIMLGRPLNEVSTMGTATTTGGTILTYGDYASGYRIVDRIGASVELVQHVFGTANNRPIGARGLYMYWRTGGGVVTPKAIRSLKVR